MFKTIDSTPRCDNSAWARIMAPHPGLKAGNRVTGPSEDIFHRAVQCLITGTDKGSQATGVPLALVDPSGIPIGGSGYTQRPCVTTNSLAPASWCMLWALRIVAPSQDNASRPAASNDGGVFGLLDPACVRFVYFAVGNKRSRAAQLLKIAADTGSSRPISIPDTEAYDA